MTREEMEQRKEQLRIENTVSSVLSKHGIHVKNGRSKAICHDGKNYTAKVSDTLYYCFKCNKSMDIFDSTIHFNHCDFWTAFELLGGTERPSFTTVIKANKAKKERESRIVKEREIRARIQRIQMFVTAYRNLINESEPYSDIWCYCYGKLQYQIYLLERCC